MSDPSGDPLFQLNTVLWMLQPLPEKPGAVYAVLYHQGYAVRALGKALTASAKLERRLASELDLRGIAAPDVLASAPMSDPWPVFECKRSSFGPQSSTSHQALKILARAAELSLVAGSPPGVEVKGCAVFVTRDDQAARLQATLDELSATLEDARVTVAPASTIGIRVETGIGLIVRLVGGSFPGAGGQALTTDVVLLRAAGPDEDARPLYLVPFDPSVEQDEEERSLCLRILLARARAHAASMIGRGPASGTVVLEGHALLDAATFGLSKFWRDTKARDAVSHEVLRFLKAGLAAMRGPSAPFVTEGSGPKRIEVVLRSEDHRQECAEAVMAYPLPGEPVIPEFVAEELPFADQRPDGV